MPLMGWDALGREVIDGAKVSCYHMKTCLQESYGLGSDVCLLLKNHCNSTDAGDDIATPTSL